MVVPQSNPTYAYILDVLGQGGTAPQIVRATNGILQVCLTNDLARIKCGQTTGSLMGVEIDQYNGNVFAVLSYSSAKDYWLYFLRSTDAGVSWTASPRVDGFQAIFTRLMVYNNRCWVLNTTTSRIYEYLGYCTFGDSMATVNQNIGGPETSSNAEIDTSDPNSVWLSHDGWFKATISGASILLTEKNPLYLGNPMTFDGIGRGKAWINPGNASHQRILHEDGVFETFDSWGTIAAVNTGVAGTHLCNAGWSDNYDWFGTFVAAALRVFDDFASTTVIDRSVAGVSGYIAYGGFQAGTTDEEA